MIVATFSKVWEAVTLAPPAEPCHALTYVESASSDIGFSPDVKCFMLTMRMSSLEKHLWLQNCQDTFNEVSAAGVAQREEFHLVWRCDPQPWRRPNHSWPQIPVFCFVNDSKLVFQLSKQAWHNNGHFECFNFQTKFISHGAFGFGGDEALLLPDKFVHQSQRDVRRDRRHRQSCTAVRKPFHML